MTWKVLLTCGICSLPVRVSAICRQMGIHLCSYGQGYTLIQQFNLGPQIHNSDGFLFRIGDSAVIFYNQARPVARQRFTIAHELGHLVLNHQGPLINREPSPKDNPIEQAANRFAADLLAPACVLRGLKVRSAFGVAQLCDISAPAASFRMARLRQLYEKDAYYMEVYGRSYFFQSPLEWKLYRQFEPFISAVQADEKARFGR